MAHASDEMNELYCVFCLTLGNMMDQVLYELYWKNTVAFENQPVAFDSDSAKERARTILVKASSIAKEGSYDYEILPKFPADFSKTMKMVKKLSKPGEVPSEERKCLLSQARAHRDYLYSKVIGN